MEQFEQEGAELRTKSWKSSQLPAAGPVYSWVTQLNSQGCKWRRAITFHTISPQEIIHEKGVDCFDIAKSEVDGGGLEASQGGEEISSEVWWNGGSRQLLIKHIESEQPLMVQVAGEPGADGRLQEGRDQEGQCAALDTEKTKSTLVNWSMKSKFAWFL